MKTTVSESEFRDAFRNIRPDNFSYAALGELYQWLEQYEDDTGEEIELDVIALCCDFCEYTIDELQSEYENVLDDCDKFSTVEEWAEWLNERTIAIPVHYRNSVSPEMDVDSVIVQAF